MLLLVRPAAAQQIPPDYEPGIFQLSIRDLPRVSIPVLLAPDGRLLFPLEPIVEAARIPMSGDSVGYDLIVLDEEMRELVAGVDTTTGLVSRGEMCAQADSTTLVRAEGFVYMSAELLSLLLAADVTADFASLDLFIVPRIPFPAQIAIETETRRRLAALRGDARRRHVAPGDEPLPSSSGGGVLHYSLSSGYPDPSNASVLGLETGFAVLGGLAAVGYTFADDAIAIDPRLTLRYERFIPNQRWISFVRAGDVLAEGAFLRSIRGAMITNKPLRRGQFFQDVVIDAEVPAGYEVEVYQGGQLIAYSDRTARDPLRVPVTYGRTDLEVRMIAPSGEVVTSSLLFGVPQTQLPEGSFEYSAGGGACHQTDCTLGYAAADYGATRWLTVGGGYELDRDTATTDHLPFARASLAPAGGWLGELRLVGDRQASASVQYTGVAPVTGGFGLDLRSAEVPRATLLPQTRTRWDTRGELGVVGHRGTFRLGGMEGGGIDRWAVGYMAPIERGLVVGSLESFGGTPTQLSASAFRLMRTRPWGGSLTMSSRLSLTEHGVEALEAGGSIGWSNATFANAGTGWSRTGGFTLSLSFSRVLDAGQIAGVMAVSGGDARTTLRADGAVAIDPFDAVRPTAYHGIGFAGVDALAFRDLNANGRQDPGEPPAAGITVQAGERTAVTDSTGHARIWGLVPWEATAIRAAPDWTDPRWMPSHADFTIRPVAHIFNRVTVPLVGTREFVAYLIPGDGVRTTAGIRFRLIEARTGTVREGMTLSDGSIYVSGAPLGDYTLQLNAEDLAFLRARPMDPIPFGITAQDDEFVFELPPIVVESAGS